MFMPDHNCYVPHGVWTNGVPEKGTWHGGKKADGTRTALLSCPACGGIGSLGDHEITADGRVKPSVVCPADGCTFHKVIVLTGWEA